MKSAIKSFLAALLASLFFASPGSADPGFDEVAAYKRGDYAAVFQFMRPFAEQGNTSAQFNLGLMYSKGQGVRKDMREAVKWFSKAGATGNAGANYMLAIYHDNGNGVARDRAAAAGYMLKSLRGRSDTAIEEMTGNVNMWSRQFRKTLQRLMKEDGVYSGPIDGKFGPGTKRAIRALAVKAREPQPSLRSAPERSASDATQPAPQSASDEFGDLKDLDKLD